MEIPKTKYDIIIEICCLLCLIGVLLYLTITWNNIPDEIPGHYNAMGQIDKITGKSSLIALPAVAWIIYIGMSIIEKFLQIWNTGVTITEENKHRIYRILKDMLKTIKLITVAVFTYLTINSAIAIPLPIWFLPVFLILTFGSLIFFIGKLVKSK